MSNKPVKMLPRGEEGEQRVKRATAAEREGGGVRGEHCRHSATFCVKSALPLLAHCVLRESTERDREREGERGAEPSSSQEEQGSVVGGGG